MTCNSYKKLPNPQQCERSQTISWPVSILQKVCIPQPIHLLTRKKAYFKWTGQCQQSFEEVNCNTGTSISQLQYRFMLPLKLMMTTLVWEENFLKNNKMMFASSCLCKQSTDISRRKLWHNWSGDIGSCIGYLPLQTLPLQSTCQSLH